MPTSPDAGPAQSKELRRAWRRRSEAPLSTDGQAIGRAPERPLAPADTSTNKLETNSRGTFRSSSTWDGADWPGGVGPACHRAANSCIHREFREREPTAAAEQQAGHR